MSADKAGMDSVEAIRASGLSIFDLLEKDSPLFVPTKELERILDAGIRGFSTAGMPLRTRSKVVKSEVCRVLGYPIPKSFRKCKPHARFHGQNFDTYVQASDNLQIWNEELKPRRRYVLIAVGEDGRVTKVKVVTGAMLAKLDTTGTLTQKYQARFITGEKTLELVSSADSAHLLPLIGSDGSFPTGKPTDDPERGSVLTIQAVFGRLSSLVGSTFASVGHHQERNRGAELHRMVCKSLGYQSYADDGQFPDVRNQLLEVKLQTSPTIDLGLVEPVSTEPLDLNGFVEGTVRHCDVRYAIFGASAADGRVTLTSLVLTTGADFFKRFPRFEGKVLNKKIQIPLPRGFFGKTKG
ncbi:MAG TPA: restriction endonuclease [Verrucomicrobiales bacterium]|nr:restriction endonuclease [Verrucomicrobiales bacterium]